MADSPFVEGSKEIISIMEKIKNREFSSDEEKQSLLNRLRDLDESVGEKLDAAMAIADVQMKCGFVSDRFACVAEALGTDVATLEALKNRTTELQDELENNPNLRQIWE